MKKIDKYLTRISIGGFLVFFMLLAKAAPETSGAIDKAYSNLLLSFIGIGGLGFVMLCLKTKNPVKEIMIGMYIALGFLITAVPANF